jgi:hypothetical protein
LSQEENGKPTIGDILAANIGLLYAIISLPLVGMVIAIGLIFYLSPPRMFLILAVIFFLIVQYMVLLIYIRAKINQIIKENSKTS